MKRSRFRCHGLSLLLPSYLYRISRKDNSACSVCGHPLQDLNHLLLDCPASEHLFVNLSLAPLSLFLTYGPDVWVWPDCWVSAEFLRAPFLGKGRVVPGASRVSRDRGGKIKIRGQRFSPKCEGFFWPKSQIVRPKAGDL